MPLVDEQTQSSDRRAPAWRAWLAVGIGLVLLWIVFTVGITWVVRTPRPGGTSAAAQVQAAVLQQAQQALSYGDAQTTARLVSGIDGSRLTLMDKHTYLKLGAESMSKTSSPLAASRYLDRYLTMSAQLYRGECGPCHTPPNAVPPARLADMTTSALGKQYIDVLRRAKALTATRDRLAKEWKKKPDDIRLNVLLYHLESAKKNHPAALNHADRLKAADKKQAGS